jgi:tripartite ATP-independent transporter DctM subunit
MGGIQNLHLIVLNGFSTIGSFTLIAVPLFILMGEILFRSGVIVIVVDALTKWIGRIPGSLSYTAVASGTLFATMSGSSMSGTAVLGSTLVPEMMRRGYSKEMSLGPILGAGGLAMIIPPSILAVLLASVAKISIARLLIAGVVPGIVLALLYCLYIALRCKIQPHLVPATEDISSFTWVDKFQALITLLPFGVIVFLVIGLIFMGIATPSEAAALGTTGSVLLTIFYRKARWSVLVTALLETLKISCMVNLILMGSLTFSQIVAYTGIGAGLVDLTTTTSLRPLLVVAAMNVLVIFLGMFMDAISILMITIPIFVPIINALGLDPIWFGVLMVVNYEMGTITPPFGLLIFVMKGVVPSATVTEVYKAGVPFFLLAFLLLGILLIFPQIATWLPAMMF